MSSICGLPTMATLSSRSPRRPRSAGVRRRRRRSAVVPASAAAIASVAVARRGRRTPLPDRARECCPRVAPLIRVCAPDRCAGSIPRRRGVVRSMTGDRVDFKYKSTQTITCHVDMSGLSCPTCCDGRDRRLDRSRCPTPRSRRSPRAAFRCRATTGRAWSPHRPHRRRRLPPRPPGAVHRRAGGARQRLGDPRPRPARPRRRDGRRARRPRTTCTR